MQHFAAVHKKYEEDSCEFLRNDLQVISLSDKTQVQSRIHSMCYGLTCDLPKFLCWSPNAQ